MTDNKAEAIAYANALLRQVEQYTTDGNDEAADNALAELMLLYRYAHDEGTTA